MGTFRFLYTQWLKFKEAGFVFVDELRRVFRDPGVLVIFILAGIAYPILYNFIYWKDNAVNLDIAHTLKHYLVATQIDGFHIEERRHIAIE